MNKDENTINYQRIEQAILYLEKNFQYQPELDDVAEKVHLSPFHFQRLFTEWAGISPKRFLQFLTVGFLKKKLENSKNLLEVAVDAVLSQSNDYIVSNSMGVVLIKILGSNNLDTSSLLPGVYFVRNGSGKTQRIIVY